MRVFARPIVVVSKCIEFEPVRYDGLIISSDLVKQLKDYVDFVPVCCARTLRRTTYAFMIFFTFLLLRMKPVRIAVAISGKTIGNGENLGIEGVDEGVELELFEGIELAVGKGDDEKAGV
jgi:hypothetical protein